MKYRQVRVLLRASVLLAGALGALGASAQEVVQTLDQVKAYSATGVVDMTLSDPYRDGGFTLPQSPATPITSGSAFVACKQTSAAGLICLTADEKIVNWSDPVDGASRAELFSCNDVDRILDVRASNTCTGVTADELGAIWLAGKNKGKTHSLVKVTAGACPNGTTGVSQTFTSSTGGGSFCAREWDTGRPLLLSVKRVEGQVATRFDVPGKTDPREGDTIVGLEQRLNAVIFSATTPNDVYEIPGGKSGWALNLKEQLQDIALLQAPDGSVGYFNYVLVSTNEGRVMAKDMANPSAAAYEVRGNNKRTCSTAGTVLSLAASPKGKIIYLSDSACKDVVALEAARSSADRLELVPAKERYIELDEDDEIIVDELRAVGPLSTVSDIGSYSPVGITVAPGQDFKLADCSGGESSGCSQVPGFKLWNLNFVNGVAVDQGVTVLQILNIPDCRWTSSDTCTGAEIDGPEGVPAAQYLNVEPLLPQEVLDVLEAKSVVLPGQLLIPPQHRAQERNGYKFDAFFFVVDDSVKFTGIFEGEFEMEKLIGQPTRCADTKYAPSVDIARQWDIVTKISEQERYVSVDGLFQDVLLNTDCGSSRTSTISLSMYNYPLEITPDTYLGQDSQDLPIVVANNDAVFARYMQKLFYDLDYVARHYACNLSDTADSYPASDLLCSTLVSNLTNAGDKLGKCIAATYQPKQSAGNQNCTSFLQQWASVKANIDSIIAADAGKADPANRRYELQQRYRVFDHVYDTRFWPSVPQGGYCREAYVLAGGTAATGCPAP